MTDEQFDVTVRVLPAGTCADAPTGTVTLTRRFPGHPDVEVTDLALTGGTLTYPYNVPDPGTYTITASYSGDDDYNATSVEITVTVGSRDLCAAKVINLTQGLEASVVGQPVTYQASVLTPEGSPFTGSATITDTDSSTATCSGTLTDGFLTCSSQAYMNAGTQTVIVNYENTCQETYEHVVNRAAPAIQLSYTPSPPTINQPVTVTAKVIAVAPGGGTPAGTVRLTFPGQPDCTANLANGSGSCTCTPPSAGSVTVTANYPGTSNYLASSNTVTMTVINNTCPYMIPANYNIFQVQSAIQFPIYNPTVSGASNTFVTSVDLTWPVTPLTLAREIRFDTDPGAGGLGQGCINNDNCLWSDAAGRSAPSQSFTGWKVTGNTVSALNKGATKYMRLVLSGSAGGHYTAVITFKNGCTLTIEGDR